MRLKGIHLAMRSGMCAADVAFRAVRENDVSAGRLSEYARRVGEGPIRRELYPVRNVHQSFAGGLFAGLLYSGLSLLTGGWWFRDPLPSHAGHERIRTIAAYFGAGASGVAGAAPDPPTVPIDRTLTFDRLTNVHYSGTRHDEDQPSHLLVRDTDICRTRCLEEYRNPCTRLLSRQRVRDRRRGRGRRQAAAGQRVELRPLQDVRHHGPLPDHRLGAARGWRRSVLRRHVSPDATTRRLSSRQVASAAAIAGVGHPVIAALCRTLRWTAEGTRHYEAIQASGRQPVMAFWHGRILHATWFFRRRGIVVMISENFDGEWIGRLIEKFGYRTARGSTSRGGSRALVRMRRLAVEGAPTGSPSMDRVARPARSSRARCGWRA